jgi:hypothetical protein
LTGYLNYEAGSIGFIHLGQKSSRGGKYKTGSSKKLFS